MKEMLPEAFEATFKHIRPDEALSRVQSAIDFIINDNDISLSDKVASAHFRPYNYEELLAALLAAKKYI